MQVSGSGQWSYDPKPSSNYPETCGEQGHQVADTISEVFWDETVKWSVDESEIKSQWL